MKQTGTADLKLMNGCIPPWLFERMVSLSLAIVESILIEYGKKEFIRKLSDPLWFQSFGAVIGMDWNSSGVTTAVMSALKKSLNPHSKELGLYICGGKGKDSIQTPQELIQVGENTGLDGNLLARNSRLSAKVDNNAIQDGFQVYMHYFVVNDDADWAVIQQGMQPQNTLARRYHWCSSHLESFVEDPHTAICGNFQGDIINLVDKRAKSTQQSILTIGKSNPEKMLNEIKHLVMPHYRDITLKDVDLKRIGSILVMSHELQTSSFEDFLLLKGLGPRTLQSLALVSEVIHGTASRFNDPARYAFAHGGKGGTPFPVPTQVYDETLEMLRTAVEKAKMGEMDKFKSIKKITEMSQKIEKNFTPDFELAALINKEKEDSWKYGGRTIKGFSQK